MHFKKLLSASLALCMTATSLFGAGVISASAEGEKLTFDIRSGDQNTVTVTTKDLADGAVTVPIAVYIPENPGLCAMNLKFQVNDGQIDENNVFQNYGITMPEAYFAEPNVFASPEDSEPMAFCSPNNMNVSWVYSVNDGNTDGVAAAEANTTAWASSVSWAYEYAFLNAELLIPENTPEGEYVFTIRTEPFVNALSSSSGKEQMSRSKCKGAASGDALEFSVTPLTIKVEAAAETTTTVPATTTSTAPVTTTTTAPAATTTSSAPAVTTTSTAPAATTTSTAPAATTTSTAPAATTTSSIETTTTTSTVETTTTTDISTVTSTTIATTTTVANGGSTAVVITTTSTAPAVVTTATSPLAVGDAWQDDYKITMEGVSHYLIMGDVQGKPGETVSVPVYVYGDTGTAGVNLKFTYDKAMKLEKFRWPGADDRAYVLSAQNSVDNYPASFSGISSDGRNLIAEDGKTIVNLMFTIPEDAKQGDTFAVSFDKESVDVCDTDGSQLDVTVFDGSVTVVTDNQVCLNKDSVSFSNIGETVNLTLFNAVGEVKWSSDNEAVAKVDQNGFVVATGKGSAVITAENNGKQYTAKVMVGVFGDANLSGDVTIEDAKRVLDEHVIVNQVFGDPIITDPAARYNADVTGDGKITEADAIAILKYVTMKASMLDPSWYELTKNANAPDAPAQ